MSKTSFVWSRAMILVAAAGLMTAVSPAWAQGGAIAEPAAQADGRKVVRKADDLPRHTYKIEGKASEFVASVDAFDKFVAEVKTNLEKDLATHDIQDNTTLQGYYQTLQSIAVLQGRFDDAIGYIEKVKALETKESQRLVAGLTLYAFVAAKKAGPDGADAALKTELDARLRALPFDKIREIITTRKAQVEMVTPELVQGQLQAALDPIVAATNGEVSGDVARQLVQIGTSIRVWLPVRKPIGEVYAKLLADNTQVAKDIWAERNVTLAPADGLTPVVIAVWDSGVDTSIFPKNLWVNPAEKANGKDNDGNGFVADVNGIAFNLDSQPVPELLYPLGNLKTPLPTVQKQARGMSDAQANIESPEASEFKKYMANLKADQVGAFIEDLSQWGNYMHGTHVAGISADGNPAARILTARLEFDYRTIPLKPPSMEESIAGAGAAKKTVDYFKAHGVRVVNMSWGGSRQDIEDSLEKKGVGKTAEERAEMARKFFNTYKEGIDEAIRSAPDILFVAAAGNSNNDSQFSEMIPSGLTAPNMITIGAVDQSGKPTGFTTFGKNVALYASGYQVESFVPGGQREKASGTSMAAPQVTNLAGKLFALKPTLTAAEAVAIITKSADPMPGNNPGRLLINPKRAVEAVKKGGA